MRLTKYIKESAFSHLYDKVGRSVEVTAQYADNYLKTKCKKSLDIPQIFRGVSTSYGKDIYLLDPKEGSNRISPYATHNYYNLLMSNLPLWSKYPKRNKSIIATTNRSDAKSRGGGEYYVVVPVDEATIGVCNEDDIWSSFDRMTYSMNNFNKILEEVMRPIAIMNSSVAYADADTNYTTFKRLCAKVDRNRDKIDMDELSYYSADEIEWVVDYMEYGDKLIDVLDNLLDPDRYGFTLRKAGDALPGGREVWTAHPSILIKVDSDFYKEIFK